MSDTATIVITGVLGVWGRRLARQLAQYPGVRVIGMDTKELSRPFEGIQYVRADVRTHGLREFFRDEKVTAVVHLAFRSRRTPSEEIFDNNVMGAMMVLGAAVDAGVHKVILRSSTLVYGAKADNPTYLKEQRELRAGRSYGYLRDMLEIERFVEGFRPQAHDTAITVLRFAHIVGPVIDTPLVRYLSLPVPPSMLGFDPLFQVIHQNDVLAALGQALLLDCNGTYNVAAEGVLTLGQLLGICGKVSLPVVHLLANPGLRLFGRLPLPGGKVEDLLPFDSEYLCYPCLGDLERMRSQLFFTPTYAARAAVEEFADAMRVARYANGRSSPPPQAESDAPAQRRQKEEGK